MPSFNQASFLRDSIDSLLRQDYPKMEIIIVDGGSSDGSIDILKSYGESIVWSSDEDKGQADAINKGFALATGDWLGWLNSDDMLLGSALHIVNETIDKNPQASIIVGKGIYVDENGDFLRDYPAIEFGEKSNNLDQLFEKGFLPQPSVYFHRDAYISVGGIDIELDYAIDYDLWVRFAKEEFTFAGTDTNLSGNRWHQQTKTSTNLLDLLSEVVKIQLREFGRVSPYFVQAISDNLYSTLHSSIRGDRAHLLYRNLYFKSVWFWLNYSKPFYCINGLIFSNISKTDPVVGDELSFSEMVNYSVKYLKSIIFTRTQSKNE